MNIYESAENYLEAILSLHERHGLVRSIDIANELHFPSLSVSVDHEKLREERDTVEMDKDGFMRPAALGGGDCAAYLLSGTSC